MTTPDRTSKIVALSGHVSAGKTTLANGLAISVEACTIYSTKTALAHTLPATRARHRLALQAYGAALDAETRGAWLLEGVMTRLEQGRLVVVDAVRTQQQLERIREARVPLLHLHLMAPRDVLADRYESRRRAYPMDELASYDEVLADTTERRVEELVFGADLALDTSQWSEATTIRFATAAIEERF